MPANYTTFNEQHHHHLKYEMAVELKRVPLVQRNRNTLSDAVQTD